MSLTVERQEQTLTRRIEGEDCASVTRAAASALALILEPSAESGAPRVKAPTPPKDAPVSQEDPKGESAPKEEPSDLALLLPESEEPARSEPNRGWNAGVRAGGGVATTLFPGTAGLVEVAAHVAFDAFRVEAFGSLFPTQTFSSSAGEYQLSFTAVGLRACWDIGPTWFVLLPCLDFELGRLKASGIKETSSALSPAAGATFLGGYRVTPSAYLLFGVPVRIPLARHQLHVNGTPVHELPSVDLRYVLGFETTWQ